RIILPNNDDGDLTYYKRRSKEQVLPLIGGTGQPTQAATRPAGGGQARGGRGAGGGGRRPAADNLPAGFSARPSGDVGPSGFPAVQMTAEHIPAALALPNPAVEALAANPGPPPTSGDVFQREWLDA